MHRVKSLKYINMLEYDSVWMPWYDSMPTTTPDTNSPRTYMMLVTCCCGNQRLRRLTISSWMQTVCYIVEEWGVKEKAYRSDVDPHYRLHNMQDAPDIIVDTEILERLLTCNRRIARLV